METICCLKAERLTTPFTTQNGPKAVCDSIGIPSPMPKIASIIRDFRDPEGSGGDVRRTSYTLLPAIRFRVILRGFAGPTVPRCDRREVVSSLSFSTARLTRLDGLKSSTKRSTNISLKQVSGDKSAAWLTKGSKLEHEPWLKYQRVATELLSKISADLGLERLEPEQKVTGKSGTEWALDAKGVAEGSGALVIVEARRRKRRPNQEQIASLAYRIQDTGADGGIVVSPVPFQAGAAKVAAAANIQHVSLTADSTAT